MKKPKLKLIPTIYPKGYKEWLDKIKHFDHVHKLLPKKLRTFDDQDGWLQAYHLNCYDSQAFDIVIGYRDMPKKKRVQDRGSQYEKELDMFIDYHSFITWDWAKEDEWSPLTYYHAGLSPLEAVDVMLGLRPINYDEEAS